MRFCPLTQQILQFHGCLPQRNSPWFISFIFKRNLAVDFTSSTLWHFLFFWNLQRKILELFFTSHICVFFFNFLVSNLCFFKVNFSTKNTVRKNLLEISNFCFKDVTATGNLLSFPVYLLLESLRQQYLLWNFAYCFLNSL